MKHTSRTLDCFRALRLLTSLVVTGGCGATVSSTEERRPEPLPDRVVSTVCQCGNCKTVSWCANSRGDFVCDIGLSCLCDLPGQIPITRGLASLTPDGVPIILYCDGPANTAADDAQAIVPFGGGRISRGSLCLMTPELAAQIPSRVPAGLLFVRDTECGTNPRCSSMPSLSGTTLAFADELNCPKASALGDPRFPVPGVDDTSAVANARPILGAVCALWSAETVVGTPMPGNGVPPAFHCFARDTPTLRVVPGMRGRAVMQGGVTIADPGHAYGGHACYASQSYNYLRVTRQSDGATALVTLSGVGSAVANSDGMSLTDLQLHQVGTASIGGYILSNSKVYLEDLWSGAPTTTYGVYTAMAADSRVQGEYTMNSATYSLRLAAIDSPTLRWNGVWYTIDARFASADVGIVYDLHAELDLSRARPTATVSPVSDVECVGPDGADVTVSGSFTGTSGATRSAWVLNTGSNVLLAPGGPTAIFRVPLLTPSSELLAVQLSVFDAALTTAASATVRVIDSIAPTLTSSWVHVDCGWGGATDDPSDPKYCVGVNGITADTCSTSSVRTLWVTQYLGCDRNMIIRQDAKSCIRPDPAHWGSNISDLVYEVDYAPEDAWGNRGTTKRRSFRVQPSSPPTAACSEPRTVTMDPCGWGW